MRTCQPYLKGAALSAGVLTIAAGTALAGAPALPTAIFSDRDTLSNSLIPNGGGDRFDTITWNRLVKSPNGQYFILNSFVAGAAAADNEMLFFAETANPGGGQVIVRESMAYTPTPGRLVQVIDDSHQVRNDGTVAWAGDLDGDTNTDDLIGMWDSTNGHSAFAQEGGDASGTFGAGAVWDILDTATINDVGAAFRATSIDGLAGGTANDAALVQKTTILAQKGITVPAGQMGTPGAWSLFDFDFESFQTNAAGTSFIAKGDTDAATTEDDLAVVDNTVVVQEGHVISGSTFASPVSAIRFVDMNGPGDWFVEGNNADGVDWVVRNGTVVAATDTEIYPGAGEMWDDTPYSVTWFGHIQNNVGDYLIAGLTNSADDAANAVLVLNGSQEVLRENDPVDLDGNGMFDDGVFINTFRDDDMFLTDDLDFWALVSLRDAAGASAGQALIYMKIPTPGTLAAVGLAGLAGLRRRRN